MKLFFSRAGFYFILSVIGLQTFPSNILAAQAPAAVTEKLDVDPMSGTASTSIPIFVPQGRGGIQPNIQFLYNSGSPNGFLGQGWVFDLGSIQRSTKRGVPSYTKADTFVFTQSGSHQELVDITGTGTQFRAKIEGAFMKFEFDGSSWLVTDKKGTKYFFGMTPTSQEYDPNNGSRKFRWALDRVEDLNGNYMTISYIKDLDLSFLLPNEILYTGHAGTPQIAPYVQVVFTYENRPDRITNHSAGYYMGYDRRMNGVQVYVNGGQLSHKYTIAYAQDPETKDSLLTSVTPLGTDGSTLPTTKFTYSQSTTDFNPSIPIGNAPNINISSGVVRIMDMNKDGFVDIVDTLANDYQIYFNNGNNDFNPSKPVINSPAPNANDPNVRYVDLNNDNLLDVVDGTQPPYKIWFNNGINGYKLGKAIANSPNQSLQGNLVQFVDMNADGYTDILETAVNNYRIFFNNKLEDFNPGVAAVESPNVLPSNNNVVFSDLDGDGALDILYGQTCPYTVWVNNRKDGFKAPVTPFVQCGGLQPISQSNLIQLVDMNADGLPDLVKTDINSAPYQIYFNLGGLVWHTAVTNPNSAPNGTATANTQFIDLNGDGFVDQISGSTTNDWKVYINDGANGFQPGKLISPSMPENLGTMNIQFADINADTLPDVLYGVQGVPGPQGAKYKVYLAKANLSSAKPGVMIKIDNSVGGITDIQYDQFKVASLLGGQIRYVYNVALFNTVKKITLSARGESYPTEYEYKNSFWSDTEREFRGFGYVKVKDVTGNYSVTNFNQDDLKKGTVQDQTSYDANNQLLAKTVNTWGTQNVYAGVNFVFLQKVDNFAYNTTGTGKRTTEEYTYGETPQLGNLTQVTQYGEVDWLQGTVNNIGSDTRTIETVYKNNTTGTNWLIGFPQYTQVKNNSGNIVRKTTFYYDGAASSATIPVKGMLSKKENWGGKAAGTIHPTTTYTYDVFGNLSTMKDANANLSGTANVTSIIYDPIYQTFPLTTLNALGQSVVNEYYGVNGVALNADGFSGYFGQLKSTTDSNQKKGQSSYDLFGRLTKTVSPLDTIGQPTNLYSYQYFPDYTRVKVSSRQVNGQASTLDSYEFRDGLGRLIQTKFAAETAGFIVSGLKSYDSRGLVTKEYLPYSVATLDALEVPDATRPFISYTYDAMGRVIKSTNPDGTYSSAAYSDWNVTTQNANGHQQMSTHDAYGRLILKTEYSGADGRSSLIYPQKNYAVYAKTTYTYDSEGNLTKTVDHLKNKTTITYNTLGQKVSMTDPDMGVWTYTYDTNGNLKTQTDAKNQKVTFTYDVLNRLKNKTDGGALNVTYTYDDKTNAKGRLTKVQYGVDNTTFTYDDLGREIESTKTIDGVGYTVKRTYDALNRLTSLEYPDQSKIYYTYNAAGQMETIANGVVSAPETISSPYVQYTLNDNAASTVILATGTGAISNTASASANTNTFSQTGKINRELNFNGTSHYVNIDNFLASVINDSTGSFTLWMKSGLYGTVFNFGGSGGYMQLEYDSNKQSLGFIITGSGTAFRCTTPNGSVPLNTYTHVAVVQDGVAVKIYVNGVNQPLTYQVNGTLGAWFTYRWVGPITFGRLGAFNISNDPSANNSFFKGAIDDLRYFKKVLSSSEIAAVYNGGAGTEALNPVVPGTGQTANMYVQNVDYTPAGQLSKIEYGNGNITTYQYDSRLRLSQILTVNSGNQPIQNLTYTYDAVGNILTITNALSTSSNQLFKYDHLGRLTNATGGYGVKSYTYNQIGNILSKDGLTYIYPAATTPRPHAVTQTTGGVITDYTYDPNGNMSTKIIGTDLTEFVYDSENRLLNYKTNGVSKAQFAYDGDGGRVKKIVGDQVTKFVGEMFEDAPAADTKFIYLGSTRIASVSGSTKLFYLADHLGGTNIIADDTGVVKEITEYDPFGKISKKIPGGTTADIAHFYFTGKKMDEETGLYYYGARYYDPGLGRFITADTIVQSPYNPQTLNRYTYCNNNPVNFVDPTGHSWKSFWKKFGNFISPLARAIITEDWKGFANIVVSAVVSVASFGTLAVFTPMIMTATTAATIGVSAMVTAAVLDTQPGQQLINFVSNEIFDDAFGMRPSTARAWGTAATYMAVNAGFQTFYAGAMTGGEKVTSKEYKYDAKNRTALDVKVDNILKNGEGFNFGSSPVDLKDVSKVLFNNSGELVGVANKANILMLGAQHTGIVMRDIPSLAGRVQLRHFPSMSHQYGLWGISHQAVNVSLLEAGYSSTVMSVGGGWTTGLSTVIYGPYGGGAAGAAIVTSQDKK